MRNLVHSMKYRGPVALQRKALNRCCAATTPFLLMLSTPSQALNWELENGVTVDLDTTISYNAQWRQEEQDQAILNGGGNPLLALTADDGNRNFDDGDMTQNRVSFGTDLDINYGDGGVFVRARGWYDEVYDDGDLAEQKHPSPVVQTLSQNKSFQRDGLDQRKSDIELLDTFLYHNFVVNDRFVSLRVGEQVVNWGESLFISGGISSAQGPLDASKANAPGVELKDIFLPIGQVYSEVELNPAFSVGAYYQWDWEETRVDAPGSYFSIFDGLGQDSVGDRVDTAAIFGRNAPVVEEEPNEGQWGVALRYLAESLNNTEFGLYYLQYNDFTPALQIDLAPAFLGNPDAVVVKHEYFEDIDLIGLSFGTVFGDTNVSGELSYRDGQPVQLENPAGFEFVPAKTAQVQISAIHSFGTTPLADNLTFTGEAGYNRVLDIEGVNGDVSDALDNDRGAASATVRAAADYFNVMNGLDLKVTGTYRNDFNGVSSVPFTFTEDVEQFSLKADFTYLNKHSFGASYVWYLANPGRIQEQKGNLELAHLNADRDYVAAYYKYRF